MAWEKLKGSAKEITPDDGVVSTAAPSLDVSHLAAKKKPGKDAKLVNPVPGFGGTAPKKAKKTK
jgi:hypothetical protein